MLTAQRSTPRQMPPPLGYMRKIITVPPSIAEAVKEYRFAHRLESDVEAYRVLIAKGLEAAAREDREAEKKRQR